ncbi:hypothetical protein [Bartonella harrusi]|nr:hypothetical protein [Bartonella harrusi]
MVRKTDNFITNKAGGNAIFRKKNIIAGNKRIRSKLEEILKKGL